MKRSTRSRPPRSLRLWDQKAREWATHVGADGDRNRQFQSDPRLWAHLGKMKGRRILDLGCGTGYLTVKFAREGALATGIDLSPSMIQLAQDHAMRERLRVEFRVDSASLLRTCPAQSFDLVASNYVLMDLPDLAGAAKASFRVLRPGGRAVMVISHPCFGAPGGPERLHNGHVRYLWPFSYFDHRTFEERWGKFSTPFAVYHRPLSTYWQAFRAAGFTVTEFEEPTVPARAAKELSTDAIVRSRMFPGSALFVLTKPA